MRTRASHGSVGLPLAFVFGREWNGTAREKGRNQHDNKRVFQLQMAYITTWSLSFWRKQQKNYSWENNLSQHGVSCFLFVLTVSKVGSALDPSQLLWVSRNSLRRHLRIGWQRSVAPLHHWQIDHCQNPKILQEVEAGKNVALMTFAKIQKMQK